ncbi:hypothetical protein C8Q76DRAFT_794872 [Earliella scabrosa]|nr:hypothetical protein C8Q76DRAFT_794872 [Earliella scabrosa]
MYPAWVRDKYTVSDSVILREGDIDDQLFVFAYEVYGARDDSGTRRSYLRIVRLPARLNIPLLVRGFDASDGDMLRTYIAFVHSPRFNDFGLPRRVWLDVRTLLLALWAFWSRAPGTSDAMYRSFAELIQNAIPRNGRQSAVIDWTPFLRQIARWAEHVLPFHVYQDRFISEAEKKTAMKTITGAPDQRDFATQAPDDLALPDEGLGTPSGAFHESFANPNEMIKEQRRQRDYWNQYPGQFDVLPDPRRLISGLGGDLGGAGEVERYLRELEETVDRVFVASDTPRAGALAVAVLLAFLLPLALVVVVIALAPSCSLAARTLTSTPPIHLAVDLAHSSSPFTFAPFPRAQRTGPVVAAPASPELASIALLDIEPTRVGLYLLPPACVVRCIRLGLRAPAWLAVVSTYPPELRCSRAQSQTPRSPVVGLPGKPMLSVRKYAGDSS